MMEGKMMRMTTTMTWRKERTLTIQTMSPIGKRWVMVTLLQSTHKITILISSFFPCFVHVLLELLNDVLPGSDIADWDLTIFLSFLLFFLLLIPLDSMISAEISLQIQLDFLSNFRPAHCELQCVSILKVYIKFHRTLVCSSNNNSQLTTHH